MDEPEIKRKPLEKIKVWENWMYENQLSGISCKYAGTIPVYRAGHFAVRAC